MKNKRGFTLIEMILVIALIVILTTVATSSLASYITNARTVSSRADHQNNYASAKTVVDGLGHVVPPEEESPAAVGKIVTFNSLGGSAVGPLSPDAGATISPPPAPTKSGSTFVAWYKDDTYSNAWNFSSDTVTGDMTLYAKWDTAAVVADPKTITYNSKGGSAVGPGSADAGATISPPSAPTKSGSTFTAWYKEDACVNAWNFSLDTVTGDMTLYAKWAATTFTVTYNPKGGSTVGPSTVSSGGVISPAPGSPTRTGYTFGSWYKEDACTTAWNFSSDTVTANITLYAKWTPSAGTPCTITYYSQGDSYVAPVNATTNAIISAPPTPTKYDHTFVGWYTDSAGTNAWNFSSVVTGNMTLYGKWIKIPTIAFDTQGGSYITPLRPAYNTTISAPAVPTKYNVTFGGWYTSSACTAAYNFASMITGDMTLYAKWTCAYTLMKNANNVSNWPADGSVTAGSALTISTTPTRPGKTFKGWYTSASCNDWEKWTSGSVLNGPITLYAGWS